MQKIKPLFNLGANKPNTRIHESQAEICINGKTYTGNGEVRLELLPRANIFLYGFFQGVPDRDIVGTSIGQVKISSFSINGRKIEGFKLSGGGNIQAREFNLKWGPKSEPIDGVGDDSTQMSVLVFHLFNLPDLHGTRCSSYKSKSRICAIQHVDLVSNEWNVELKSLPSTEKSIKKLKEEGGYRLTHIGVLKKTDGAQFSGKDAKKYLSVIGHFLSFAIGDWCQPVCAVGEDRSGNRVWEIWSSPKEPWHFNLSWFDPHNSLQLEALFPHFIEKCNNDDWGEALREVIYWCLNANNSARGIDTGIILTQAALERLSYEYVVKERRLLSLEGYKNIWASDKFRIIFSSLNIPCEIPHEMHTIKKLANKHNWLDAPHALTEIRNSLVHPEHKKRGQLGPVYYEAWNLGLWYLEMGILAICGYSGTYGNRLKQRYVGQTEDVPWK